MDRERQIQDDVSELPQESALRSIPISVKVVSRLRRGSGGVPFPSAPERVRSSDSTSSTSSLGGSRARSGSRVGHWVKSTLYLTETMLSYEVLGEVGFSVFWESLSIYSTPIAIAAWYALLPHQSMWLLSVVISLIIM